PGLTKNAWYRCPVRFAKAAGLGKLEHGPRRRFAHARRSGVACDHLVGAGEQRRWHGEAPLECHWMLCCCGSVSGRPAGRGSATGRGLSLRGLAGRVVTNRPTPHLPPGSVPPIRKSERKPRVCRG